MRLEGTLDAFSLPDIFQLLSFTKKTGALHLQRAGQHGVVHVRDGAVTGGRSDVGRQALGRRLVGAGLVDEQVLADAVDDVQDDPSLGLGRVLVDSGHVDEAAARALALEAASDAVFELLRWEDGEFAFVVDEPNPDDVGASAPVEEVVAEGQRRVGAWLELADRVPSLEAVVTVVASPLAEPAFSREEWSLVALVDGRRTVGDLVALTGTGEFVVVAALAALVDRGLVQVGAAAVDDAHGRRAQLLASLEGAGPAPVAAPVPASVVAEPVVEAPAPAPAQVPEARPAVIPERPEPFVPPRRPEHAEPAYARYAASASVASVASAPAPSEPAASVGSVQGAHALQPDSSPSSYIDRDPSVNKSLLLRLIAGVRGL